MDDTTQGLALVEWSLRIEAELAASQVHEVEQRAREAAMQAKLNRNMKVLSTTVATAGVRGCVVRASSPGYSSPDAARPGWPDYALSR